MKPVISVLIPVYNQEKRIEDCLKSVVWADEILVVDSFSADKTLDICRKYTDKIIQHEYVNSAAQKNWALANLEFCGDWILIIDSDEVMTPELKDEILKRAGREKYLGYYFPRKNFFLGKWIRHGGWYPDWNIKLFKKGSGRFEDKSVHAEAVISGSVGYMKNPIIHYPRESIGDYLKHMDQFTTWRAQDIYKSQSGEMEVELVSLPKLSRPLLKFIWRWLPFKPFWRFIWFYVLKLGFLDGYRGFLLALLWGFDLYLSYAKCWELKVKEQNENRH
ncbi:MAG: glycosyltransferase family 2 protein [Candidatus Margulisiibacteriota bacterium]